MVKPAVDRTRKYAIGVNPEKVAADLAAQKPAMVEQESRYLAAIAEVERKVKVICEAQGVATVQVAQYLNFARKMWSLADRFSGATLAAEAQLLCNLWAARQLDPALLVVIAKLFGVTPAAPTPSWPLRLSDLLDVEITAPVDCQFLHYDGAAAKWHNRALLAGDIPNVETLSYGGAFALAQIPRVDLTKVPLGSSGYFLKGQGALDSIYALLTLTDIPTMDLAHIPTPLTGKDADTVDTYHAASLEKTANKGVASGYCDLDAAVLVPTARIPGLDATKITSGVLAAARVAPDVLTTQGDLLIRNGAGYARLGFGISGQFLKTQGVGADPVWADVPSGASSFWREFWQKQGTSVKGSWSWVANALQTDFSSVTGEAAGIYTNGTGGANLDEYKWASVYLANGTYKVTCIVLVGNGGDNAFNGIMEILFGVTSLGTKDLYGATVGNTVVTFTFTLVAAATADFRFRVNGKNASSSGYRVNFSRLFIEKTA